MSLRKETPAFDGAGGDAAGADGTAPSVEGRSSPEWAEDFEHYAMKLIRESFTRLELEPSSKTSQGLPPKTDGHPGRASASSQLPAAQPGDLRYDTGHRRTGRAVLINNAHFEEDTDLPQRTGTRVDVERLTAALGSLGLRVMVFQDLRCGQIKRLMHLLSGEDHSDADCLLVAVMTHGDDGEVYGTDGPMPVRHITAPFRGDSCRSLIGKPKIFIFQACRGIMVDQGVAIHHRDVDEPDALIGNESARTVPVEADFLLAYSSPEGYASWRNAMEGAWFIQSLARAIQAYGTSWEFTRILTLVNRMVALQYESLSANTFMTRKKQMPCFLSTLTKDLYFRPKGACVKEAKDSDES